MSHTVYLSLGSNLGDRMANLREAIRRLASFGRVISVSSFYETEPVEVTNQAWFVNCAAALESNVSLPELMQDLLRIEREMGRERVQKKGPRTIDIDILMAGDSIVNTSDLTVPHPAMQHRRFALEPLAEIAPEARHPELNKTIRELLDDLPSGQTVKRIEE